MPSILISAFVMLLLISISISKTYSSTIRENFSRYLQRNQNVGKNQFGIRWPPYRSSRYLFTFPLSNSYERHNSLQYITQKPIINWKPMSSEHSFEGSSKPVPDLIVGQNNYENIFRTKAENYAINMSKHNTSYRKLTHNLNEKIPLIKPLAQLKTKNMNNSKNEEINYKSIVNGLQKIILRNISVVFEKSNAKEINRTFIDLKNINNNLEYKKLNNIYNQEKVFSPKYEYGFKPLENNENSLQNKLKNYLHFIDDYIEKREDEKEILNDKNDRNSKYLRENITKNNQNEISLNNSSNGNYSTDEKNEQFIGYKNDFHDKIASQLSSNTEIIKEEIKQKNNEFNKFNSIKESNSYFLSDYSDLTQLKSSGLECARDFGWCDFDLNNYPKDFVNRIVAKCIKELSMMYIEIPNNLSDFDEYVQYSEMKNHIKNSKFKKSLCDSHRYFVRPSIGQDINGNYYIIVQTSFYYQTIPIEICRNPGSLCTGIENCGINVRCTQKYRTHLLISVDNKSGECPQMRLYRMPTACVCETSFHN